MRPRSAAVALTAAALLAVTSCSGEGGDGGPDEGRPTAAPSPSSTPRTMPPGDAAALKDAVRAYVDAYFAPDVDAAYAMFSARCRKAESKDGLAVSLERAEAANADGVRYELERFAVDEFSGDTALVTYGVGEDSRFDLRGRQWVREGGEWRYDAC
ncbi:MAG TPA: nuclear transport factor 2 family protein [Streptomyces sp.]|uniref:nuclear transport factor 2 family protein n=1 Tax=Streptomyces sp. TaxID=1931 RepID=UPI002D29950B|nr:nuclear transport factor 2 family protein [Streptomyces sp.]HZG02284.1 nuclear transport factor 2 family protein [Streptomyces sp.]